MTNNVWSYYVAYVGSWEIQNHGRNMGQSLETMISCVHEFKLPLVMLSRLELVDFVFKVLNPRQTIFFMFDVTIFRPIIHAKITSTSRYLPFYKCKRS